MSNFDVIIKYVLKSEGGFSNNKHDAGGITNRGVSLKFLKSLDLADSDLNGDGKVDGDDIRCINVDEAKTLYKKFFWDKYGLEAFSDSIHMQYVFFDTCVNCGFKAAVKILQQTLNQNFMLDVDGILGANTKAAYTQMIDKKQLAHDYNILRVKYYKELIKKRPEFEVFINGWLNRVLQVNDNLKLLGN